MIASPSVTPWNAPAINGLSSGALQNTTSFAQPSESFSFVSTAVSFTIFPIRRMASMSRPVFVEPTLTELHTRSVQASAFGIERIRFRSASVIFFDTSAVYPPIKLTPTCFAAQSSAFAISTKSSGDWQAEPPTRETGVIEIRLFTIGIPYSILISSPTATKFLAMRTILSVIFLHSRPRSLSTQSNRLIPIVIVRTSRFSSSIILFVSMTSFILIMLRFHPPT